MDMESESVGSINPCRFSGGATGGIASAALPSVALVACDLKVFARPCTALTQRGVDDSEMPVTGNEADTADADDLPQFFSGDLHRAGHRSGAGRRLRECGGHGGVERYMTLHLLHHLVNVPVENGDRAEALEYRESLRAIPSGPSPLGIDRPERNVREDDDGRARGQTGGIFGEPIHLLGADLAEASELDAVVEANEVDALVVKTLPRFARGSLAEALKVHLASVGSGVVFAGDIEHLLLAQPFEDLIQGVEFGSLGLVGEVAGVENQLRLVDRRVDLADSDLQGAVYVGNSRPIEADVAVADLDESEVGGLLFWSAE
jgi:hypothetical protein